MDYRGHNVIIGAGISGCVCAFYDPSSLLIDDGIERDDNPFVFIQKNKYTSKLLSDLGITVDSIPVNVCAGDSTYIADGKIGDNQMGQRWYLGTDKISNTGRDDSVIVYKITENEICWKIKKIIGNRIFAGKAEEITKDNIYLDSGIKIAYNKIISTINFKDFERIAPFWNAGPDVTVGGIWIKIEEYDGHSSSIVYFEDSPDSIKKIVYNSIQKKKAIEYSKMVDGAVFVDKVRFYGQISPPPEGIIFAGRFATGNPHWRIEDSVYIAQNGYEFIEMINEQRRFDKAVKNKSKILKESRIQRLILGAHSELSEILREIPYNMHRKEKRSIKSTNVLEECIDVFKYLLAIMHEFDYTPREINDMFYTKSEKLWERFNEEFYGGV